MIDLRAFYIELWRCHPFFRFASGFFAPLSFRSLDDLPNAPSLPDSIVKQKLHHKERGKGVAQILQRTEANRPDSKQRATGQIVHWRNRYLFISFSTQSRGNIYYRILTAADIQGSSQNSIVNAAATILLRQQSTLPLYGCRYLCRPTENL